MVLLRMSVAELSMSRPPPKPVRDWLPVMVQFSIVTEPLSSKAPPPAKMAPPRAALLVTTATPLRVRASSAAMMAPPAFVPALPWVRVRPEMVTLMAPSLPSSTEKMREASPPLTVITPAPGPWMVTGQVMSNWPRRVMVPLSPGWKTMVSALAGSALAARTAWRRLPESKGARVVTVKVAAGTARSSSCSTAKRTRAGRRGLLGHKRIVMVESPGGEKVWVKRGPTLGQVGRQRGQGDGVVDLRLALAVDRGLHDQ